MAYISPEQRAKKKEEYDAVVYEIFVTEGWEALTYQNVANRLLGDNGKKLTKSSLQRYYPKRIDFGRSLIGKVAPVIISKLDFFDKQAFIESWVQALDDDFFRMVIQMFIENALESTEKTGSKMGTERLLNVMKATIPSEECTEALEIVFGKSVIYFLNK